MRLRSVVAAGVLVLLSAPAAFAQSQIEGGGDFDSAPVLEAGVEYRDTARPGEKLYYGIELAAGQKLKAQVTVNGKGLDDTIYPDLLLYSPQREEDVFVSDDGILDAGERVRLRVEGEYVGGDGLYAQPGVYFVSLAMNTTGSPPRAELKATIQIDVDTDPLASPAPSESAPAEASPTEPVPSESPSSEPPSEGTDDGDGASGPTSDQEDGASSDMPIYLASFAIGAGLGAAAITVSVPKRRAHRTHS